MGSNRILIVSTGLLLSGASFAFNPVQGWYGSLLGEVSYVPSLDFFTPNSFSIPQTQTKGTLDYRVGGGGGGMIGYRCAPWRLEGEILYNINQYSKITVGDFEIKHLNNSSSTGLSIKGNTYLIAGLVNAYYEIYPRQTQMDNQIVPYLGIGAGFASVNNDLKVYDDGELVTSNAKDSSNQGIFQVIIGAQYFADDFTSFGVDYRYMSTGKLNNSDSRYQLHTLNLTLNFSFDRTG